MPLFKYKKSMQALIAPSITKPDDGPVDWIDVEEVRLRSGASELLITSTKEGLTVEYRQSKTGKKADVAFATSATGAKLVVST